MKNLAAAFFLFFTLQLAGQSGTITTNILNKQTGSPNPGYTVSAYQGDEKLGSVTADNKGVASLDVVLTDVLYTQRINNFSVSEVVADEETRRPSVFVQSPKYTNVNYIVYTLPLARELSKGTIHLEYGHNQVLFPEAGADGRRLIVFDGGGFSGAFKYISADNKPISARTVSNPMNALGKLNGVDEEVKLVFEDDGYVTKDTTLTLPTGEVFNVNVDGSMDRVPNVTEAMITTMYIYGENLPGFPVHFVLGGKDSVYTSDSNGLIPFKHTDFSDPYVEKMKVYFDDPEDESPQDLWMGKIIVKHNHPDANMGDGEITQNESYNWSSHADLYVPLNKLNEYFNIAMKFTPRFGTDAEGKTVDMKTADISYMSNAYATLESGNIRWEKYNGADTIYTFIQTNTQDTNEPVPQESIDTAVESLIFVRNIYDNQQNGTKTLNFSEIKFIENLSDTFYQDLLNNKELQNVYLVQFSGGNPGNSVKKREGASIWQYASVEVGTGSSYNKMVSEMISPLGGFRDGIYNVGYYFLFEANFGKIWANYAQEHAKGEPFLKNPDL